jgi:hypothetical protein
MEPSNVQTNKNVVPVGIPTIMLILTVVIVKVLTPNVLIVLVLKLSYSKVLVISHVQMDIMLKPTLIVVNHVTLNVKLVSDQLDGIVISVFLVFMLTMIHLIMLWNVLTHVHTDIMKTPNLDNVPLVTKTVGQQ